MAADTKVPVFKLSLDGSPISKELESAILVIQTMSDMGRAGRAAVTVQDSARKWIKQEVFKIGKEVEIQLGFQGDAGLVFKGEITGWEVLVDEEGSSKLVGICQDRLHRLPRGTKIRTWLDAKDSDIVKKIATENGLQAQADDTKIVHPYVLQYNLDDYDFILEMAGRHGFEVVVSDKTLVFRKPKLDGGTSTKLTWGKDLYRFAQEVNTFYQVAEVEGRGRTTKLDKPKAEGIKGMAKKGDVWSKMGGTTTGPDLVAKMGFPKKTDVKLTSGLATDFAEAVAKAELNRRAGEFVIGEGRSMGNHKVSVGQVVELEKLGKYIDGKYYVVGVTHRYETDRGYVTEFRVRRYAIGKPEKPATDKLEEKRKKDKQTEEEKKKQKEREEKAAQDARDKAAESEKGKDKKEEPVHWVEFTLQDDKGKALPRKSYEVTLPNGKKQSGRTDSEGHARFEAQPSKSWSLSITDELAGLSHIIEFWVKDEQGQAVGGEQYNVVLGPREYAGQLDDEGHQKIQTDRAGTFTLKVGQPPPGAKPKEGADGAAGGGLGGSIAKVKEAAAKATAKAKEAAEAAKKAGGAVKDAAQKAAKGDFSGAIDAVAKAAGAVEDAKKAIEGAVAAADQAVKSGAEAAQGAIAQAKETIEKAQKGIGEAMELVGGAADAIGLTKDPKIKRALEIAKAAADKAVEAADLGIKSANEIVSGATDLWEAVKGGNLEGAAAALEKLGQAGEDAKAAVEAAKSVADIAKGATEKAEAGKTADAKKDADAAKKEGAKAKEASTKAADSGAKAKEASSGAKENSAAGGGKAGGPRGAVKPKADAGADADESADEGADAGKPKEKKSASGDKKPGEPKADAKETGSTAAKPAAGTAPKADAAKAPAAQATKAAADSKAKTDASAKSPEAAKSPAPGDAKAPTADAAKSPQGGVEKAPAAGEAKAPAPAATNAPGGDAKADAAKATAPGVAKAPEGAAKAPAGAQAPADAKAPGAAGDAKAPADVKAPKASDAKAPAPADAKAGDAKAPGAPDAKAPDAPKREGAEEAVGAAAAGTAVAGGGAVAAQSAGADVNNVGSSGKAAVKDAGLDKKPSKEEMDKEIAAGSAIAADPSKAASIGDSASKGPQGAASAVTGAASGTAPPKSVADIKKPGIGAAPPRGSIKAPPPPAADEPELAPLKAYTGASNVSPAGAKPSPAALTDEEPALESLVPDKSALDKANAGKRGGIGSAVESVADKAKPGSGGSGKTS